MTISPTWAIALGTAAVLGIVIVAAAYSGASARWPGRLAYLLGGALAGFLAIAFAPAWPMLAVMGTVLVGMALRDRRPADAALLVTGFGATGTLMIGLAVLNDLMDPAVHGSPDTVRWFVGGAAALVLGLAWLLGLTLGERPT